MPPRRPPTAHVWNQSARGMVEGRECENDGGVMEEWQGGGGVEEWAE